MEINTRRSRVFFHWVNKDKYPLSFEAEEWLQYLQLISDSEKKYYVMLEFVKDDDIEQYVKDAILLRQIIIDLENRNKGLLLSKICE